jgi:hypothetical protein
MNKQERIARREKRAQMQLIRSPEGSVNELQVKSIVDLVSAEILKAAGGVDMDTGFYKNSLRKIIDALEKERYDA